MIPSRPPSKAEALAWFEETMRQNGETSPPKRVYKFMSPASPHFKENMRNAIVGSTLYLTPRAYFNDPFDTSVACDAGTVEAQHEYLREISSRNGDGVADDAEAFETLASEYYRDDCFERDIQHNLASIGVCSLTAEVENLLMWAYYADSHRGVALIFNMDTERAHFDAVPVRYQEHFSRIGPSVLAIDGMLFYGPLHKGADWRHEKEWRIVKPQEAGSQFLFDWSLLWGVVHGMRCEQETMQFVASLCLERIKAGMPPLHLYDARPRQNAYGLDFYEAIPVKRPHPINFKEMLPTPPKII